MSEQMSDYYDVATMSLSLAIFAYEKHYGTSNDRLYMVLAAITRRSSPSSAHVVVDKALQRRASVMMIINAIRS